MSNQEEQANSITVTVSQKKSTDFSRETFSSSESVTLVNTNAEEVGLLRKILHIKMLNTVLFEMIVADAVLTESLVPADVSVSVDISNIRLETITERISELDDSALPNKADLVLHLMVTKTIIDDINDQLG